MDPVVKEILNEDMLIPLVAIVFGCTVAVVAIVAGAVRGIATARAKELTKRELAAYVAEGTLDADKAVAMINAGRPHWETGGAGGKNACC